MKGSPKSDADQHKKNSRLVAAELEVRSALKELDDMKKGVNDMQKTLHGIEKQKEKILNDAVSSILPDLKALQAKTLRFSDEYEDGAATSSRTEKPSASASASKVEKTVEKPKKSFFKKK